MPKKIKSEELESECGSIQDKIIDLTIELQEKQEQLVEILKGRRITLYRA